MDEIGLIVGAVIAVLVFVSVLPSLENQTVAAAGNGSGIAGYGNGNVTSNAPVAAMMQLLPLVFVAVGVIMIASFLRVV